MSGSFDPLLTIAGLLVGFFIGVCGVGGGALMTPFLIYYGIPPATAVGTDLMFAAITKGGGVLGHHRQGGVVWPVVLSMMLGSIPASLVTLNFLDSMDLGESSRLITTILALTLFATALTLFFPRRHLLTTEGMKLSQQQTRALTLLLGLVIGVLVTITSVGAGALGAALLLLLYPRLPMARIVGSDIAHALPLTLVASLGHLQMGHVDLPLLIALVIGSLPGVVLGSRYSGHLCERLMRRLMASLLMLIAIGLLL